MDDRITLDVYDTDADAFEATAERAAAILRAALGRGRATIATSGGRAGRGVLLALAARTDVPWDRIEWYWADERCVPPDDGHSNVRLARENLLGPRRIPAARIHPPPVELGDPARVAATYADTLRAELDPGPAPVFDLVLLGLGPDGHVASLPPGSAALRATDPVVAVGADEMNTPPAVARITLTPPVLQAARHVLLTACGAEKAAAVAAALREPVDPIRRPAQLVRPGGTVAWVVDMAAAGDLLKAAAPAPGA